MWLLWLEMLLCYKAGHQKKSVPTFGATSKYLTCMPSISASTPTCASHAPHHNTHSNCRRSAQPAKQMHTCCGAACALPSFALISAGHRGCRMGGPWKSQTPLSSSEKNP